MNKHRICILFILIMFLYVKIFEFEIILKQINKFLIHLWKISFNLTYILLLLDSIL